MREDAIENVAVEQDDEDRPPRRLVETKAAM